MRMPLSPRFKCDLCGFTRPMELLGHTDGVEDETAFPTRFPATHTGMKPVSYCQPCLDSPHQPSGESRS